MTVKKTMPTVSLMSKDYTWIRSESTDVRATFAKARAELAATKQTPPVTNVKPMRKSRG